MKKIYKNFITFEGIDGSGKSTVIKMIYDKICDLKLDNKVILTREPGGTEIAEKIRTLIIENEMSPETEALLYAASRSEHIKNIIKPEIEKKNIVLCDRFLQSSLCYQGLFRKVGYKNVFNINRIAVRNINPGLIFYLNISLETSKNRMNNQNRENTKDRFDILSDASKKDIINNYDKVLKKFKGVHYIDGEKSLETICEEIFKIIMDTVFMQQLLTEKENNKLRKLIKKNEKK